MAQQGIAVVLCGISELDQLVEDYGLLDWFPHLYSFGSLEVKDFIATLNTIEEQYLRLPEASRLSEGQNLQTLALKTHSYIGKLIKIIQVATLRSLEKGFQKIDGKVLEKAAAKYGVPYKPPALTYLQASSPSGSTQSPQPALPPTSEPEGQPSE
ncbi:hypothetical protein H6F67_01885 [Microcoleus sp. FACHB-1515]|uniref:hypothetical protein n=1 Tax=Cyanophyceae TaxID=3028117 RepID=UPI001688F550|nr:hypothetical protein [Microcoleus sp. FACHB-1515]MBD2088611.1 hypothetical protein [Microcoleus sp. FACHB-1515]